MLRKNNQMTISFSKFNDIYDILISEDNKWRRMKNEIDFSFVYDLVKDNYSITMGRTAKNVEFMFKLLLLKIDSGLSDEGLIKMIKVNMEYKFFLDNKTIISDDTVKGTFSSENEIIKNFLKDIN